MSITDPSVQQQPFAYYAERLSACPVWHEAAVDTYIVGGMEEARATLTDHATFSSSPARRTATANPVHVAYAQTLATKGVGRATTLQRTDPPVHTGYRSVLNRVFTPGRVKKLAPSIESIVADLVAPLAAAGRCEFVGDFALPMPGIFIAEQLGLERSDYKTFRRWAEAMLCLANRPDISMDEAMHEVEVELDAQRHLMAAIDQRRQHPADDLLSLVANARHDNGEFFDPHQVYDLTHQLITGGFETTTAGLSTAMLALVTHPDQQELLRSQPDLLSNFVEESLRWDSPVQGLWRRSMCPVDVAGVAIPADASVMVRYGAANRDPRVFDDPDRFDITRPNAGSHVAFGLGAHFCLGAALARQEMLSSFSALLAATSWLELDGDLPDPLYDPSVFLRPMRALPIRMRA